MSRIVVIDDEPTMRLTLSYLLEQAGHQVWAAENGRIGVDVCRAQRPDLVITDIVMPEQEGVETFEILHAEFPDMPVIAMSGDEAPEKLQEAVDSGYLYYVMKPVNTPDLLHIIAAMIAPAAVDQAARAISPKAASRRASANPR